MPRDFSKWKIQSIHLGLGGAIYGILDVRNWLLLEQTLCNAVTLGDYFSLSLRNDKLQWRSLGALFAKLVCACWRLKAESPDEQQQAEGGHRRSHHCNWFTPATDKPKLLLPPPLQKAIDCCSIKQKWDCHSLRWRRENCLIWFSIAIWVFGSYFTVVITKGNEVCFVMLPGALPSIITLMNSPPEQTPWLVC